MILQAVLALALKALISLEAFFSVCFIDMNFYYEHLITRVSKTFAHSDSLSIDSLIKGCNLPPEVVLNVCLVSHIQGKGRVINPQLDTDILLQSDRRLFKLPCWNPPLK